MCERSCVYVCIIESVNIFISEREFVCVRTYVCVRETQRVVLVYVFCACRTLELQKTVSHYHKQQVDTGKHDYRWPRRFPEKNIGFTHSKQLSNSSTKVGRLIEYRNRYSDSLLLIPSRRSTVWLIHIPLRGYLLSTKCTEHRGCTLLARLRVVRTGNIGSKVSECMCAKGRHSSLKTEFDLLIAASKIDVGIGMQQMPREQSNWFFPSSFFFGCCWRISRWWRETCTTYVPGRFPLSPLWWQKRELCRAF